MYTQRHDSPLKCTSNNVGGRRGEAARKQKRKPWVSEESKLFWRKLTIHRGQGSCTPLPTKSSSNRCAHAAKKKEEESHPFGLNMCQPKDMRQRGAVRFHFWSYSLGSSLLSVSNYCLLQEQDNGDAREDFESILGLPESFEKHFFGNISAEAAGWVWVGVGMGVWASPFQICLLHIRLHGNKVCFWGDLRVAERYREMKFSCQPKEVIHGKGPWVPLGSSLSHDFEWVPAFNPQN